MDRHKSLELRRLAMHALWRKFNRLDPAVKLAAMIDCHVDALPDRGGEWTQDDMGAVRAIHDTAAQAPSEKERLDHWAKHGVPDHWRDTFRRIGILHM